MVGLGQHGFLNLGWQVFLTGSATLDEVLNVLVNVGPIEGEASSCLRA